MEKTKEEDIKISQKDWKVLQEKLKMLEEVADKGRIFDYQSKNAPTKHPLSVKVSVYNDKYIIGWRTLKFELGRNPQTGRTTFAGETAEYEIKLLDNEGVESTEKISGYNAFSDARYDKRVECPVLSKKESANGELFYEVSLPNGKSYDFNGRFIN